MTHAALVEIAARWLRTAKKCSVVLVDASGAGIEVPDAIGFRLGGRMSFLVECKTSRSDFLRDADKLHRRAGLGVGQRRLYMTPAGLLRPDELPLGWGLVEVDERGRARTRVQVGKISAYDREVSWRETGLLFAALAALQAEPGIVCSISGARVHPRVRRYDGSWGRACSPCLRAKRACAGS